MLESVGGAISKGPGPSGSSVLVSSLRLSLWSHSFLLGLALTYLPMGRAQPSPHPRPFLRFCGEFLSEPICTIRREYDRTWARFRFSKGQPRPELSLPAHSFFPHKSGRGSILQDQVTPSVLGSGRIQSSQHLLSPVLSCRRCTSSTTTPILRTRTWLRSG